MSGHDRKELLKEAQDFMQSKGLRLTSRRSLLLEFLIDEHGPHSAEDIRDRLQRKNPRGSLDLVTVYRTLASFEELGLVTACRFGDGTVRYEFEHPSGCHHHHHVICRSCKSVEILEGCSLPESSMRELEKKGYTALTHSLEVFGLCAKCAKKKRA